MRRLTLLCVALTVAAATLALAHGGAGATTGRIVADSGFRPKVDGFSFANYAGGKTNLSANQVRMLYGSSVCAFVKKSGTCVLTPPGQAWLKQQNRGMNGGHCTGMSVLSLMLFRNQYPSFGRRTSKLRRRGNVRLQRAIAYAYAWQQLPEVVDKSIYGTPSEVLLTLISALQQRGGETYSMGIYQPGYAGGHEITPFAVEERGGGRHDVLVYDNNYPGQTRRLHINTRANTWSYKFEPGSVYRGNARTKTLMLAPVSPGLGVHACPFCSGRGASKSPSNELRLEGNPVNHAHLMIVDDQGRRTGYAGSRLVNEIPGARAFRPRTVANGGVRQEPVYRIPAHLNLKVTIDGRRLRDGDTEYLSVIGPGRYAAMDNLRIKPGDINSFEVSGAVSRFAYRSAPGHTESPLLHIGLVGAGKAYRIGVKALSLKGTSVITSQNDRARGTLTFHDSGAGTQTFKVILAAYLKGKVRELDARQVRLAPNQKAVVHYGSIRPGQKAIPITIS